MLTRNSIPEHSRALIERLLQAYCARICPPSARNTVLIGFRIDDDFAVIHETKRICGVPGTCRPMPVARFRYRARSTDWALDYFFEGHWRRYPSLPSSASFLRLLREFDLDPAGHFWGRLDGKSLRWCSSKGRCLDCELRYREVLGLGGSVDAPAAEIAVATPVNVRSARR